MKWKHSTLENPQLNERARRNQIHDQRDAQAELRLRKLQRRLRFVSMDRRHFWRMPRRLWMPIVIVLALLLIAALVEIGSQ